MNRKPSSTANCRPLELEFSKETNDFIRLKSQEIQNAMKTLKVTKVTVCEKLCQVSHRVMLTMIDGKVNSAITGTGAATCGICKAKPVQMNDIDAILKRDCCEAAMKLGFAVLHLHIRFLEYFLNIAKRLGVAERCYGTYTAIQEAKMNQRHKYICKRFADEMGLHLDKPTNKGGNSNTGNTARRFFDNPCKVRIFEILVRKHSPTYSSFNDSFEICYRLLISQDLI